LVQNFYAEIFTIAIPQAFVWVIIAWMVTDKSILRKTTPYLGIFTVIFLEKIYLSSIEAIDYFYVFIKFVITITVFLILWHLARPKDFTKTNSLKSKKMLIVIFTSISMIMPYLISTVVCGSYALIIHGLFFAAGLTAFSTVITNITGKTRYKLYTLVFVFALIVSITMSLNNGINLSLVPSTLIFFIVSFVSYFFIFLSLLLLTKTKYLE